MTRPSAKLCLTIAATCFAGHIAMKAVQFTQDNFDLTDALNNSNGNIDTACKNHLSAIRLAQTGYYAAADTMSLHPPALFQRDMEECILTANTIQQELNI